MNNIKQKEAISFDGLGIAPKLLEILTSLGYLTPTPIQSQAIPVALERKDMVGIAQTGTGKTLAFGIPMLQLLAAHKGMGLVLLPTRELATQVDESLKVIGKKIGLRTTVLIGGDPMDKQLKSLKRKPHIIIATLGRLTDHAQRKTVDLKKVRVLVLDEADMMLDMGFLPQIKTILRLVSKQRQTMLFSATMPSQIVRIASEYMKMPTRIEVAPSGTSAENVEQEIIVVEKAYKIDYLIDILGKTRGAVLIFMSTRHDVISLTKELKRYKFSAAEIHSDRSLGQRSEALEGFKLGKYRILIATDIAARGIDVKEIELVVNYDLPEKTDDYVHRIGRTARAGKSGKAISFVMPSQIRTLRAIERLINKSIKINKTEEELRAIVLTVPDEKKGKSAGRRSGGRRR
ncbi:MAG: DEAD/DEAH box helicase [Patescibacteria group bacterium]|jgi:ATP-dependent RNA helicase RhlE|nr:DEAD/DEAH box helicase [Patescibacteria group bacterium]